MRNEVKCKAVAPGRNELPRSYFCYSLSKGDVFRHGHSSKVVFDVVVHPDFSSSVYKNKRCKELNINSIVETTANSGDTAELA
jgi:hypothetical protein